MTTRGIVVFLAGSIIGFFLMSYLLDEFDKHYNIEITISIDTIKVGRNTMYWSNDTLWNDENHTQFLKAYPKELLEGKIINNIN